MIIATSSLSVFTCVSLRIGKTYLAQAKPLTAEDAEVRRETQEKQKRDLIVLFLMLHNTLACFSCAFCVLCGERFCLCNKNDLRFGAGL
jgi:hypothetical protein